MTEHTHSRRAILVGTAAILAASPLRLIAEGAAPAIHVIKDPDCGCCSDWIEILVDDGFAVTSEPRSAAALARYKSDQGIPEAMFSCHTGKAAGYMIEGHVPPADIRRLLQERPDAIGLAVPGMPVGSPGMGPESEREAYDVFLVRRDGSTEVYASYPAA